MLSTRLLSRRLQGSVHKFKILCNPNKKPGVLTVVPAASYQHHINRPQKPSQEPVNHLYDDPALNVVPEREEFSDVWFRITGYDFVSVESYSKFVHRMLKSLQLDCEVIAMPPRTRDISTYKPYSEDTEHSYQLSDAHRIVRASDVPGPVLSVLTDMLHRHIPPGVQLTLAEADPDVLEFRFVPDGEIKAMEDAIDDLDNPRLKKKKKGGARRD